MRDFFISKSVNIGALCGFLKSEKNSLYLDYLISNTPQLDLTIAERVYYLVNEIDNPILCDCGKLCKFIGFKSGYRPTCGDKSCFVLKRKTTMMDKWGVDNPLKSSVIKDKIRGKMVDRWGVEYPMQNDLIKNKFKSSMMDKWGVEWPLQNSEINSKARSNYCPNLESIRIRSEKIRTKSLLEKLEIDRKRKNTIIEKWGSLDNYLLYFNSKVSDTSIKRFGSKHHLSSPDVIEKRVNSYYDSITNKIKLKLPENIEYIDRIKNEKNTDLRIILKCDCGEITTINRQYLYFRLNSKLNPCLHCNPILSGKSNMELELLEYVKSIYEKTILVNKKSVISNELDIYLPDLKLAFEFNGLYWHSEEYKDKFYHLKKTNECLDRGIRLIHIWEDDWIFRKEIVKSIIRNKLGISNKIGARECIVRELDDNKIVNTFLDKNHIQGSVTSKIKLALFYRNEIVSIMTFGSLRKSLGSKSKNGDWELLRFCNVLDYSIIGGASKLLNYFLNNFKPNNIISYSDNSRGVGDLYKNLNFKLVSETAPNYYWIVDGVRMNRFKYRKDKLVGMGYDSSKTEVEIMHSLGYKRIFNCGSKKWIRNFNN